MEHRYLINPDKRIVNLFGVRILLAAFALCLSLPIFAAPEINLTPIPPCLCEVRMDPSSGANIFSGYQSAIDGSSAYQAGFNSKTWSGFLKKSPLSGGANITAATTYDADQSNWNAADILTHRADPLKRTIITFNPATKASIPFEFESLSPDLQAAFNQSPIPDVTHNLGVQRVRYLYGDRQLEKPTTQTTTPLFRVRDSLLGDIVNSTPLYAGGVSENKYGADYPNFFAQFKNRQGVVYVGANDGMLHAFSAKSGVELFSYIPSPLLDKLPTLSYPSYRHDFYMDGKIAVDEAQVSGIWKTVLAAGMGRGAKGLFALDVTRPDAFTDGKQVLFEFTNNDDPDIGFILAAPSIVKINDGSVPASPSGAHYFVVTPGGINTGNPTGDSFLFLISLDKPANSPWLLNKNYFKLRVPASSLSAANTLTKPGFASDSQGAVTNAYAGDLQGNIWRFDLSGAENFTAIKPTILFTARDGDNSPQPITAQPVISFAPGGGYLIQFGTGKYLEQSDTNPVNFRPNSFYTIRDTITAPQKNYAVNGRNELAIRRLSDVTIEGKTGYQTTGDDFIFGDTSGAKTKKGWYIDFPGATSTGERSLSAALPAFGDIYFNTFTPGKTCGSSGASNSYAFNSLTGKVSHSQLVTGQKSQSPLSGIPLFLRGELTPGAADSFGRRIDIWHYSILNFGPDNIAAPSPGAIEAQTDFKIELKSGRLSWREIQNWQDGK